MRYDKIVFGCLMLAGVLAGCSQYDFNQEYAKEMKDLLPDFDMYNVEVAKMDFGREAAGKTAHVYSQDGVNVMNVFLDENGRFEGRFRGEVRNGSKWRTTVDEGPVGSGKRKVAMMPQHGYYIFEDIWTMKKGDFDLNDVIVEYSYSDSIVMEGGRRYLEELVIDIKPRHSGTEHVDGFALQLPEFITTLRDADRITSIRVNGGEDLKNKSSLWRKISPSNSDMNGAKINTKKLDDRFTYEFFKDIHDVPAGTAYRLVVTFDTSKEKCVTPEEWNEMCHPAGALADRKNAYKYRWDYNPFITVHDISVGSVLDSADDAVYIEVHLPFYPFTESGIPSAAQAGSQAYSNDWHLWYVCAVGAGSTGNLAEVKWFYPFALDVPYSDAFRPCMEGMKISNCYAGFTNWMRKIGANENWFTFPYANHVQPFNK
ncbi:MAG: LruC domain-containing protein [Bacteroidaceae bacterium]|nr:LruC domain-containing protein [Bacteroidaceae bacterium]